MLAQHVDIGLGDCVRIEGAVRLVGRVGVSRAAHSAINNEMGDVNALGPQLARRALRQSAQRKLSHGEGRGERESFDARGRSGEQDGTPPAGHHALCGLLGDEEAAEGSDGDCLLHRGRIEIGDRPVRPGAGIVDDEIGLAETLVDFVEKLGDGTCFGRIHRESGCAGLSGECIQLADIARGEADLHVKRRQAPSERRANAGSGADDQGTAIGKVSHIVRPLQVCLVPRAVLENAPRIVIRKGSKGSEFYGSNFDQPIFDDLIGATVYLSISTSGDDWEQRQKPRLRKIDRLLFAIALNTKAFRHAPGQLRDFRAMFSDIAGRSVRLQIEDEQL
jgi:hypothetical protein